MKPAHKDEAREADCRREAPEKRAWELQAWSASLERQVEARRAALASLRGTPAEEEEVRKRVVKRLRNSSQDATVDPGRLSSQARSAPVTAMGSQMAMTLSSP